MVGKSGDVRVVDFGLARAPAEAWGWEGGEDNQTTAAGTPAYMAPEAARGSVDARSDQFALAVTIVEALTREPGDDRPAIDLLVEGMALLPKGLREPVDRATNPDPRERFDSVFPLLAALQKPHGFEWKPVWVGGAVLGGLGLLTVAALSAGSGPEASDAAPAKTAVASAPEPELKPGRLACAGLDGQWDFETTVEWAENTRFMGAVGVYELHLRQIRRCEFTAELFMTGEKGNSYGKYSLRDMQQVTVEEGARTSKLALDVDLKSSRKGTGLRPRQFEFELTEGRVTGTWTGQLEDEGPDVMRGRLRGKLK
jgi:hypothetical protein